VNCLPRKSLMQVGNRNFGLLQSVLLILSLLHACQVTGTVPLKLAS